VTPVALLEPTQTAPTIDEIFDEITRREFIVGAGAIAGAVLLGACEPDDEPGTRARSWSFTDDRGIEVTATEQPARIVVYEDFLPVFWQYGLRPVGVLAQSALEDNIHITATAERLGIELSETQALSTVYGEVNLEQMAGLQPDLTVSWFNTLADEAAYGFANASMDDRAEAIAPFVLFDVHNTVPVGTIRATELVTALGGQEPAGGSGRDRYDAAATRITAAATAKPGMRVLCALPIGADGVFVADPDIYPLTALLASLGVSVIDKPGEAWQYSWELVPTELRSDVVLLGQEESYPSSDELAAEYPTWGRHPAVEAGQVASVYPNNLPPEWNLIATTLEEIADVLEASEPLGSTP
jgi:ABC-type Fe3+-hydroxamate transport system substrate-binding protein